MRHAALLRAEITHGSWDVAHRQAAPAQPYRRLDVEIEAPHPAAALHHGQQRLDGIDPEPEQGVMDACPEGLHVRPPVGDLAALDPQVRGAGVENRLAQDQRLGVLCRGGHEGGNPVGRVLAVGVHGQNMGVALGARGNQAVQHGCPFPPVAGAGQDPQTGIAVRHLSQALGGPIGAAVHDHPHGGPLLPGRLDGVIDLRPGVVAGDQDEVGCGVRRHVIERCRRLAARSPR